MALSWEQFLDCVEHFLSVSDSLNDDWVVVDKSGNILQRQPDNCYLYKKVVESYTLAVEPSEEQTLFVEDIEPDSATLASPSSCLSRTLIWDYHILYSPSYSVPVLYFNVRSASGRLLPLDEVWNILKVPEEVLTEKWSFVTQQEHPILLRPFFCLHPCRSFQFLKVNENSTVNPLVTWLSSISHIVHLHLPLDYGKSLFPK